MNKIIVNKIFVQENLNLSFGIFRQIRILLEDLNDEYPDFFVWLNMVFDGVYRGERTILLYQVNNQYLAISILKHTEFEKKICTFRVLNAYKRLSIGKQLMKESLELLDEKFPLITVSSKRIEEFRPFLYKFKFEEYKTYKSYYRSDIIEYSFNAPIEKKCNKIFKCKIF
ncbi:hypothetical protein [Parabacteroides johnsonii]|uniref:hypothetical protein n=1 Tax=Parabacteroides johnsonii TaxID=387661 RepID=UPI0015B7CA68|nr:hypothetical protein [Parabacteroides johnsonii]